MLLDRAASDFEKQCCGACFRGRLIRSGTFAEHSLEILLQEFEFCPGHPDPTWVSQLDGTIEGTVLAEQIVSGSHASDTYSLWTEYAEDDPAMIRASKLKTVREWRSFRAQSASL